MDDLKKKPESYWKERLTPEQFEICIRKGTERPFTGQYNDHKEEGVYVCTACGQELFRSAEKFESHCGWPSFWDPTKMENVEFHSDLSHGMKRIEVTCGRCGAHLGHVFDDGPEPTGKRYCINSISLGFQAEKIKK